MRLAPRAALFGILCVLATGTPAAEKNRAVLRLDGKTAYGAAHCKALDLQDAVTMEAWINPGKFASGSARIIDKDDDAYMLDTWPGHSLRMITGNVQTRFAAKLPQGEWSHVVGVYSRTEGVRKLYLNGREVASTGAKNMPKMKSNRFPLRVGNATRTRTCRFRGQMDRVTIYNRALKPDEIAALAADKDHKPHNLPGTVADWDFAKALKGVYVSSGPAKLKLAPIVARGGLGSPAGGVELSGQASPPKGELTLWWRKPAASWNDAAPVGNGRLGAMVFGGVQTERLQLNDDTLWGAGLYDPSNPESLKVLPVVRRLIFAGKRDEAAKVAAAMLSKPLRQMPYQTIGSVYLKFAGHEKASDYRRDLDLDSAVVRVSYDSDGVKYVREILSSAIDQVVVMRLTADKPGKISFSAEFSSPQQATVKAYGSDGLTLTGIGGEAQGVAGKIKFQTRLRILASGGKTSADNEQVTVTNADSATLLISAATNYKNYKDLTADPEALSLSHIAKASVRS